jgi:hypothetical protein
VAVRFEQAKSKAKYHLAVSQEGRGTMECDAPCSLDLQPGRADVTVTGEGRFTQTITVTPATSRFVVSHLNLGMMVPGGVVLGIGLLGSAVEAATKPALVPAIVEAVVYVGHAIVGACLMTNAGKNEILPAAARPQQTAGVRFEGVWASPAPARTGGFTAGAAFSF